MNDLERKLIENMMQIVERSATDEEKRDLRETLLAIRLLERVPNQKPAIWQDPRFWSFGFAVLALIAALFGVQIPKEFIPLGGK